VPITTAAASVVATSSSVATDRLTNQRSFSRGLRAPANPVAKPPRSFADLRPPIALDQSKTSTDLSGGGTVPDSDWLARISASGIQRPHQQQVAATTGLNRPGTTRKWVKNLQPVKTAAVDLVGPAGSETTSGRGAVVEEADDDVAAARPKLDAATCLEQLKFSTKSILDQHR
jgi:hypothetical protein